MIWILFIALTFTTTVYADFAILLDKQSKEVVNISANENDFKISEADKDNLEVKIVNKDLESFGLDSAVQDYKFQGNKFILNTAKISERENKKDVELQNLNKQKDEQVSAKNKLKALGLTQDEVDSFIK